MPTNIPRFPDADAAAAGAGRILRSQPDPSPNAPRDQTRRKGPCCDSTESAFAAKKVDGSVVAWGDARGGGKLGGIAAQLESGVDVIYSTDSAFAAKKLDGSVA